MRTRDEALVSCGAVTNNNPSPTLDGRTQKLRVAILDAAKHPVKVRAAEPSLEARAAQPS